MSHGRAIVLLEDNPNKRKRICLSWGKSGGVYAIERTGWRRLLVLLKSLHAGGIDYSVRWFMFSKRPIVVVKW